MCLTRNLYLLASLSRHYCWCLPTQDYLETSCATALVLKNPQHALGSTDYVQYVINSSLLPEVAWLPVFVVLQRPEHLACTLLKWPQWLSSCFTRHRQNSTNCNRRTTLVQIPIFTHFGPISLKTFPKQKREKIMCSGYQWWVMKCASLGEYNCNPCLRKNKRLCIKCGISCK